jgi:uncharacterized protein (TIRG00374 family)
VAHQRWIGPAVVVVGLLVAALSLRDALPDPAGVWHLLGTANRTWLVLAAVLQFGSMVMFGLQQRRLLKVFGVDLPVRQAVELTYARTAVSIALPAGAAMSSAFALRQFRLRGADIGAATAVIIASGVQAIAALVVVYVAWFASVGIGGAQWSGVAFAGATVAVVFVVLRFLPRIRDRSSNVDLFRVDLALPDRWWRRRAHAIAEAAANSLRSASALTVRDWIAGSGYAMANWLADVACLLAVARAVGLTLGVLPIVGTYLAVQIVRQVPLTPGAIGVVEASMLVGLVAAGATDVSAAAVVFIYRLLSCWLVAPVGLVTWIRLRTVPAMSPAGPPISPLHSGRTAADKPKACFRSSARRCLLEQA